jgi:hypothetical protein
MNVTGSLYKKTKRKEISAMCYNCGCGMPNNDMGNPKNITNQTFEEAAKTMNQSPMDAKRNARELLERVFSAKQESTDKNWKP